MGKFLIVSTLLLFIVNCAKNGEVMESSEMSGKKDIVTIAGGCFWCIEAPFEGLDGVYSVVSGYSGGTEKDPTYSEVSSGKTGHLESVQIVFNPAVISYAEILDIYWKLFDPTDAGGSFADRGTQYQSAIFYHSEKQKEMAEASRAFLDESNKFDSPIVTKIRSFDAFYPAETEHQDYYKKSPAKYKAYRAASGRDEFIMEHWDVPSAKKYPAVPKDELKEKLTSLQYEVTMESGTEPAFNNEYWDNKIPGIYVCIISGAPLFCSTDKYKSGTGWPSFTKPIDARMLTKPADYSVGISRIEVRSKYGESHVGHVFNDGPYPTNLRYCLNSAALKFIPKSVMRQEGYEKYLWLFESKNVGDSSKKKLKKTATN